MLGVVGSNSWMLHVVVVVWPSLQSRSQSPRYPCPALWDKHLQLDILLAKIRARAAVPEVNNNSVVPKPWMCTLDVHALGAIASSTNMTFKTPGKSLPRPLNQQHVLGCFNFSFVSNPIDLFGDNSDHESENYEHYRGVIIVKVKGPYSGLIIVLVKGTIYLELSPIKQSCARGLAPNKETQLAKRKKRRRRKIILRQENGNQRQTNRT